MTVNNLMAIALIIGQDIARQDWENWGFDKAYAYALDKAKQREAVYFEVVAQWALKYVIGEVK